MQQSQIKVAKAIAQNAVKKIIKTGRKTQTRGFSLTPETYAGIVRLAETLDIYTSNIVESVLSAFVQYCTENPKEIDKIKAHLTAQVQKWEEGKIIKRRSHRPSLEALSAQIGLRTTGKKK